VSDLPNVTNDAIAEFQTEYERISASIARDSGIRRSLIKRAKEGGVPTDMAVLAVKTRKKQSPADTQRDLYDLLRAMHIQGVQIDGQALFGWPTEVSPHTASAMAAWQAESQGYEAGRTGADPGANPHLDGSDLYRAWEHAYRRGASDHSQQGEAEVVPAPRARRARRSRTGDIAQEQDAAD
jgi:hypothetical protein